MATTKKGRESNFAIKGQVNLADVRGVPNDLQLMAYAFDRFGRPLAQAPINTKGGYDVKLDLEQATDVELVIGPAGEPHTIRKSAVHSEHVMAKDLANGVFELNPFIPDYIWRPWRPIRICISGHIRKLTDHGACPVPFTKVEIFDVDRESCYWPWLVDRYDWLKDRLTVRIPELIPNPPFPPQPIPGPDPAPFRERFAQRLNEVALNPQPLPPHEGMVNLNPQPEVPSMTNLQINPQALVGFNPQPDPPVNLRTLGYVGEIAQARPEVLKAVEDVTLTSKLAPWVLHPHCFYSKEEICETVTDECGYFRCCFYWYPFHFRNGRLRYDARPDIILKVTQIINGIPTVLYLDPYSATRWNTTSTHIDLYLDDERIVCGDCGHQNERPEGTMAFFTRIGNDEVYHIDQSNGLYHEGGVSHVAYGKTLRVFAQFGDTLSRHQAMPGATAPYYYKLSYSNDGTNFTAVGATLEDTRVHNVTAAQNTHKLGPYTINGVPSLYEIRDFANYLWYNPDWIGTWNTLVEDDTDLYTLRLEVYDANGNKLTSSLIDYRDGTVTPPNVLPSMVDRCDLQIRIDNKGPVVGLTVLGFEDELNDCGVIEWSPTLALNFHATASQENGRLRSWGLYYTKGFGGGATYLASGTHPAGVPASVNQIVSGAPLLAGLTSTCAFGLKVWAYAHVRNGYSYIYYDEDIQALTIEKCA